MGKGITTSSDLSSCGGLMLVREAEKECDIIDRISSCIKDDSIMKMCAERLPSDAPLASQPNITNIGCGISDSREHCCLNIRKWLKRTTSKSVEDKTRHVNKPDKQKLRPQTLRRKANYG